MYINGGVMKNTTKLFKVLSNEIRLGIMALLYQRELCVCEIEKILHINQTTASRHLTVLKYSGLVKNRREGLWIYYSIVAPEDEIGKKMFGCLGGLIKNYPELRINPKTINKCINKTNIKVKE